MIRGVIFGLLIVGLAGIIPCAADETYDDAERNHWSLKPRSNPPVPQFDAAVDRNWIANPIDAFVLAKLKEQGLRPAAPADRQTLVRRVYFDLLGLPPSPDDVAEFVNDAAPDAYSRLVDRLLDNPHYGERWGQHWLDVARFAETEGFEYDRHLPNAWRYRDYVIRSFQQDKPYDQFLREQLAGDEQTPSTEEGRIAAGFLRWGAIRRNAGNPDVAFSRNEVLTEMTDTVSVALLGLTMGCARCHDHKFDPIRQTDYYRLQAFLASTYEFEIPLASAAEQAAWKVATDKVNAEVKKLESALDQSTGDSKRALQEQVKAAERELPAPLPSITTVKNDTALRTVIHVLKRGDETKRGDQVRPRVPGVLLAEGAAELAADMAQPRTQLAAWLTDPANPLTARVIVNRVWLNHFGRGLVNTPNDFGLNGEAPSHPELLDYLANEFVASGWSFKALHRLILSSSTYRQSSQASELSASAQRDSDNRFYGKFTSRRLQAEEIRDAMLLVAGKLNSRAGGPSVMVPVDAELVGLLYKPSQWVVTEDATEHQRRSIYLLKKRNLALPFLEVFDQPGLQSSCPKRQASTHAPQALELLNGPLSNELARHFALRLEGEAGTDRVKQVRLAFELITGREPSAKEQELSLQFLKTQSLNEFALAMFNLNEFLYVK